MPSPVHAQGTAFTTEILHQFALPGSAPLAPLAQHSNGNIYGTSVAGGAHDHGTLFRFNASAGLTTLHSFSTADGIQPTGALVEGADGALYGTASGGGANNFGTLFKITPDGTFSKLLDFTGTSGPALGSVPSSLALHPDGFFYGTTESGGSSSNGTIFRLDPQGNLATLLEFTGTAGAAPGSAPIGPLTVVGTTLWGASRSGGSSGLGTLFSLSTAGTYTHKGSFGSAFAGGNPASPLIKHPDGTFYGATENGGDKGFGLIFQVDAVGANFTQIHPFDDSSGSRPTGPLSIDEQGAIWGAASSGGEFGFGCLFKINPEGSYQLAQSFAGEGGPVAPGASPLGGLLLGSDGALYGTTSAGGAGQRGTLFSFSKTGSYASLAHFTTQLGWSPSGAPSLSSDGEILIPLAAGGAKGAGTVLKILNDGQLALKGTLDPTIASIPRGTLIQDGNAIVGIATSEGSTGRGAVFKVANDGTVSLATTFSSTAGEGFAGPLLLTADGTKIGVSQAGGLGNNGTLFRIDLAGKLSREFSFTGVSGSKKGKSPRPTLAQTPDGTLYGVTEAGGASDQGTIFSIAPDGVFATLVEFTANGPRNPNSGLALASNGKLYGTTYAGGAFDSGSIIEFDPIARSWATPFSFGDATGSSSGSHPVGQLTLGSDGAFYGLTESATNGSGTAYRYNPTTSKFETLSSISDLAPERRGGPSRVIYPGIVAEGGLTLAPDGYTYGTLPSGGAYGGGMVFRINTLPPFALWKKQMLGDTLALDAADPDQDGRPNLLEYALSGDPISPDLNRNFSMNVEFVSGAPLMAVQLLRDPSRSDVNISVETSVSPSGPWTPVALSLLGEAFFGTATILETLGDTALYSTLISIEANDQAAKKFLRVRAYR